MTLAFISFNVKVFVKNNFLERYLRNGNDVCAFVGHIVIIES